MKNIGIIGGGLIGSSWALLFARAGHTVRVYDSEPNGREQALQGIKEAIDDSLALLLAQQPDVVLSRIQFVDTLEAAVSNADYVQEAVFESLEIKQTLFEVLDKLSPEHAILASSTSTFGASDFTESLVGRERCLVVHPMTPPHLMPVVEMVASRWTTEEVVQAATELMLQVGQVPVRVKKEVPGFVLNRLQGAMLLEMFDLVSTDVINASDADLIISKGLGLRWATLGPFEGVDLNAPTGIQGYLERYGHIFNGMASEKGLPEPVNQELIDQLHQSMRTALQLDQLDAKRSWRDQTITQILLQMQSAERNKPCSM